MILIVASCGSTNVDTPGTSVGTTTTTAPSTEYEALAVARATWAANRPDSYEFQYRLECECDQGPWTVLVGADDVVFTHEQNGQVPTAPYESIESIFDEIDATIEDEIVPVSVEYDPNLGYPLTYIYNEPELPVDGGFVLRMIEFTTDPDTASGDQGDVFAEARDRWEEAGLVDYDYTFTRGCFCPQEYVGPYKASVREGKVTAATFNGLDLLEIETVSIGSYDEIVQTVDGVFDEIERALTDADSFTAQYDAELGYPTEVYIDWEELTADEEVNYTIAEVRPVGDGPLACSTTGVDIELTPQSDLPAQVAAKRQAIFDAAMDCDIAAVADLTDPKGFTASFGGGDPRELWTEAEGRDDDVMLDLVRHLNLAHSLPGEDGLYIWPSAFVDLQAANGAGLSDEDYADLLTLYSAEDLKNMFDGIGGYVGYRIGMQSDGTWIFFVAGD